MKKIFYFLIFFIFLSSVNLVYSNEELTYVLSDINKNPDSYMIIIPSKMSSEEDASIVYFAKTLGLTKSKFDIETTIDEKDLIIIGNSNVNKITKKLIGEWNYKKGKVLIEARSNNLIIAGTSEKDLISAINSAQKMIKKSKNIEKDKTINTISEREDEDVEKDIEDKIRKPSNTFFLLTSILSLFSILIISIALFLFYKKNKDKNLIKQNKNLINQDTTKLTEYIKKCFAQNYSEEQIRQILLKNRWDEELLDSIFKSLKR